MTILTAMPDGANEPWCGVVDGTVLAGFMRFPVQYCDMESRLY